MKFVTFLSEILTLLIISPHFTIDIALSETAMENHTYKHCLLNDFNLLILYYMCYWNFCDNLIFRASAKTPLFYQLIMSHQAVTFSERETASRKNGLQSQKCYFFTNYVSFTKMFSLGKTILWGKFFFFREILSSQKS